MKVRSFIATALLVVFPLTALSQQVALPEDLLLGGEVSKVLSIRQLNVTTFEVKQQAQVEEATPLNLATFCTAGWLAHDRGFAGFTLGIPKDADPTAKPALTLVLMSSESQLAALPMTHNWIQYLDLKSMRKGCTQFLGQKYLWPAE